MTRKVVTAITVFYDRNSIDVLWSKEFLENGEVVMSKDEANSFTQDRKEQFIEEVEGAEHYIAALGW